MGGILSSSPMAQKIITTVTSSTSSPQNPKPGAPTPRPAPPCPSNNKRRRGRRRGEKPRSPRRGATPTRAETATCAHRKAEHGGRDLVQEPHSAEAHHRSHQQHQALEPHAQPPLQAARRERPLERVVERAEDAVVHALADTRAERADRQQALRRRGGGGGGGRAGRWMRGPGRRSGSQGPGRPPPGTEPGTVCRELRCGRRPPARAAAGARRAPSAPRRPPRGRPHLDHRPRAMGARPAPHLPLQHARRRGAARTSTIDRMRASTGDRAAASRRCACADART